MSQLLDDQPATGSDDKLRFDRIVAVIEKEVLGRTGTDPFVVGLFGRWGRGKSSLLKMLGEHLQRQRLTIEYSADRSGTGWGLSSRLAWWLGLAPLSGPCRCPRYAPYAYPAWVVVEFSPWTYRQEKNLLVPLLACLAKREPAAEKLVKAIVNSGPDLVKALGDMGAEFAKSYGLPLLGFLQTLLKRGKTPKDLVEQIADAIETITADGRKIAFLIDDLDRCHDPAQIVGLLEQIKLFLHLPNCLFFIAADRGQIVQAIETQFPGEGTRYLEKFVQLAIELPQADDRHIVDLLPKGIETDQRECMHRAGQVFGNNPRKFKALWNRSHICLALLRQELQEVTGIAHTPDLRLMLRWLLMQEAGLFQTNPYMALGLEAIWGNEHGCVDERQRRAWFDALLNAGGVPDNQADGVSPATEAWREHFRRRLAVYLWQDRTIRFGSARVLAFYLKATGADFPVTRTWLEQQLYDGTTHFAFLALAGENLSGAHLRGAEFNRCDFERADLSHTDLRDTKFSACRLAGVRFDDCDFTGVQFHGCYGLDQLDTAADTYERLADLLR